MQLTSTLIIIPSPTGTFGWRPDKKGGEQNHRGWRARGINANVNNRTQRELRWR